MNNYKIIKRPIPDVSELPDVEKQIKEGKKRTNT